MTTHPPNQTIGYIGNFRPPHSTENHVAETLRRMGHRVVPLQEDAPAMWTDMLSRGALATLGLDLLLWTRTGWDPPVPADFQLAMLEHANRLGIPTVAFHLDRWWGLARQAEIEDSPYFQCDLVCTADGGHSDAWEVAGVNHLWLPPAVAEWECGWGTYRPELASDVAFVGSWQSYHPEWPWRTRMVRQVQNRYGSRRFRAWPMRNQEAIRGQQLRDLYASATVIVGDSCLVPALDGKPISGYWSDRIPETLGRGGLLVHPHVDGLHGQGFVAGRNIMLTMPENIASLFEVIDAALALPVEERWEIRRQGMATVMAFHTYRHRMETVLDAVAHRMGVAS